MILNDTEPDFSPEHRREAIYATDARKLAAADGAFNVWREKTGREDPPVLDGVEAVQMGKILQEPIMRAAADRWSLDFRALPIEAQHPSIPYMRSHFDYLSADGKTLYEVKNYNVFKTKEYDEDTGAMPAADLWQCAHELECFPQASSIELIVLFGGQTLRRFHVDTFSVRDALLSAERALWDAVATDTQPEPRTEAQARTAYDRSVVGQGLVANQAMERICARLATLREQRGVIEEEETKLRGAIMAAMKDAEALYAPDGVTLATWKSGADSTMFDAKALEAAYPDIYRQFQKTRKGARRFLLK